MSTNDNVTKESSDLIGQRQIRLGKVEKLKSLGIDPYPAKSYKNTDIKDIVENYSQYEDKTVVIAGRLMSWREHGHLVFGNIEDATAKIQLYIKDDELLNTDKSKQILGFSDLNLLDVGDIIEVEGYVTKTQRGEISVTPKSLRMLTKTIRPLPNSWQGFKDIEERFRRRYVDMAINKEVRDRFARRSKFWEGHREFFKKEGFYEINIPILEHIPGGGDAVPFLTHMNAIDEDFYLRISHELPLKRLIGGGYDKVYDIGARFRNEGLSDEHLPEHVAMEFYWAYADWKDGMKFVQNLINFVINYVYGESKKFNIRGFEIDFSKEWDIIDFNEVMKARFGIKDIYTVTLPEVIELLKKNNLEVDKSINIARGVDKLWKQIRKTIGGPAFLVNHPKYLSPLQKSSTENPNMVERFQPIIAGSEAGNGWSEVNDPVDQYQRFVEQQNLRDSGDEEAQWLDIDYVEMLEYGMAPTFGYGHSERLFWFLEDVTAKEGVPFPQLKFHIPDIAREIYKEVDFDEILNHRRSSKESGDFEALYQKINLEKLSELSIVEIDKEVCEKFNGIKTGFVVIEDIKVEKEVELLTEFKNHINTKVKEKYKSQTEVKNSERLQSFREIYKGFGVDPNSRLNSSEALIRRIASGKGLYNINNIVDTYNVTSAEFEVPMAAYDLDQVKGNITLRFAKEGEEIHKIGDEEATKIEEGELIYADDAGVVCLDYNYRDSDRTKVTNKTRNIILFVDGSEKLTENEIREILEIAANRVIKFAGGKVKGYKIVSNK
jgi:lysyl-tRNA synthetase class 2